MRNEKLKGRSVLITGAAKRIGKEIATRLAEEGVNLILHYNTSRKEVEQLAKIVRTKKVKVETIKANLEIEDECLALIERAVEKFPSLSIMINNASIYSESSFKELTYWELERNIKINAWAPYVLSRSFAKKVKHGKIVNLLDSRVEGYDRTHLGYFLSKSMFALMTKICAIELAPNITVNAVAPGYIYLSSKETGLKNLRKLFPLRKFGSVDDVVDAILFLLKSEHITGEVIYVDGGRHLV